jgi:hypothetical protein
VSVAGIDHVDETGAPCARHPAAEIENLLQLALVGSRAPVFHHDCASKLQGLVMALDEIRELTLNGDPQLTSALEIALDSMHELHALLNANRALTKPPRRTEIAVGDLVGRAAERAGVALHGTLPDAMVSVAVSPATHALAIAIEVAVGARRGRTLVIDGGLVAREVELVLHAVAPSPADASEALAIATFVVTRDGGRLWCAAAGDRLVLRLPCS